LAKREDKSEFHYRKKVSNFKQTFKGYHYELLSKINSDLLDLLGDEK
jgi:hypothetical protein